MTAAHVDTPQSVRRKSAVRTPVRVQPEAPGSVGFLNILRLQRLAGNQAVIARLPLLRQISIQRAPTTAPAQPKVPLAKRPEDTVTYEEWLASFSSLQTFSALDTVPDAFGTGHRVFGDTAASHDPKAPAEERPADPLFQTAESKLADHFIDHPTQKWLNANLPDELIETAYRLPSDCADIVVILRHVWLFKHNRTERHGAWVLGVGAGKTVAARQRSLNQVIQQVGSGNVDQVVNPYVDKSGNLMMSFDALKRVLHPGDILVWKHLKRTKAGVQRTGGHSQTIISVTRSGDTVTEIAATQGNQPINESEAKEIRAFTHTKNPRGTGKDPLRDQPGRRVELGTLSTSNNRLGDENNVWTWDAGTDHPTVLVAAGPAASARRGAGGKARTLGKPQDWLPALRTARRDTLQGTFEAALQSLRGQIEGGGEVAPEVARSLGEVAGGRSFALARQKPPLDDSSRQALIASLTNVINALGSAAVPASATAVAAAFAQVRNSFQNSAQRNEIQVGGVRRIPVEGLTLGHQPSKSGASGKAIVLVPTSLGISSTAAPASVQVLLHLHGFNADLGKGAASHDVKFDQMESQLEASGRPMVAVVPQGSSGARFGGNTFDADAYVAEVLGKLTSLGVWPAAPKVSQTVMTAHSGGGFSLTEGGMLGSSNAPSKLGEVALFDAINGPNELAAVEDWLFNKQIPADIARLLAEPDDAARLKLLPSMLRFRAYHDGGPNAVPSRRRLDYPGLHKTLQNELNDRLNSLASSTGLSPAIFADLRTHYAVIAVGTDKKRAEHEPMVGHGNLRDALSNSPTP